MDERKRKKWGERPFVTAEDASVGRVDLFCAGRKHASEGKKEHEF